MNAPVAPQQGRPLAPSTAAAQPAALPPSAEEARRIDGECEGLLTAMAPQKRYSPGEVEARLAEAWADGILTQDEWEEATQMDITDSAWDCLGGSLMTDRDGEKVFTSRADFLRALNHFQNFSQITGISLSYYCHASDVTLVSSDELVAWLDTLNAEQLQLMCQNPRLRESLEAIIERASQEQIADLNPDVEGDEARYHNQMFGALVRLKNNPQRRHMWLMVGAAIMHHLNGAADQDGIHLDELNLQDPLVARRFLETVVEPIVLGQDGATGITEQQYAEIQEFEGQVAQLREIVGGEPPGSAPIRTDDGTPIYLNSLNPNSPQFNDALVQLTSDAYPTEAARNAAVLEILQGAPVFDATPTHIPNPGADPHLAPVGGTMTGAPTAPPVITSGDDVEPVDPNSPAGRLLVSGAVDLGGPELTLEQPPELPPAPGGELPPSIDVQLEEPEFGAGLGFGTPLTFGTGLHFAEPQPPLY